MSWFMHIWISGIRKFDIRKSGYLTVPKIRPDPDSDLRSFEKGGGRVPVQNKSLRYKNL